MTKDWDTCRAPLLYDRSEFEKIRETFDIKNILKRFKSSFYDNVGLPIHRSSVKDENNCVISYCYLIDEPYDSCNPQGLFLSEQITIKIEIQHSKGNHTLEECIWKKRFRLLEEENRKIQKERDNIDNDD